MKHLLLAILFTFSVSLPQENDKNVIVKKIIVNSDQEEKEVDVNIELENDLMTLTIKQNGEENVFKVNIDDIDALKALKDELDNLDIDYHMLRMGDKDEEESHDFFSDNMNGFHFDYEGGGYLGVQIQDITDQLRDYFKVKGDGGVLVSEVVKESPAENAGLEAGDVIMKVNDVRISDTGELTQTIRNEKPESNVDITVIRKGREKSLKATLGSSDDSIPWFKKMGNHHKKGMKKHKMMMKKLGNVCTSDCGDNCTRKGQMKIDMDMVMPEGIKEMMKKKIYWNNDDELEKLKKDVEELRKEINKQSDS